jgi:hypothetical protein
MSIHLPPTAGIIYTPSTTNGQPRISPIAHFVRSANDGLGKETFDAEEAIPTAGRLLAVNSSYIAYAVKKGLVRVIDRQSSAKALLRGHASRIVDASFFGDSQKEGIGGLWKELAAARTGEFSTTGTAAANNGAASAASDILATIGGLNDSLFIWRIYNDGELKADKLIELKFGPNSTVGCPSRILWHPFDPNRFMLLHRKGSKSVASLVETKRLVTQRAEEGHMVCECEGDIPGATQFIISDNEAAAFGVNDASWSGKDAKHILTAHDDGIRLWDVIAPVVEADDKKSFQCIAKLPIDGVTRVIFLSQYENQADAITPPFVTGTDMNHTLTLWGGFDSSGKAQKVSTFTLQASTPSISTLMSVELIPAPYRPTDTTPSSFLLVSERENSRMHALHLATEWKTAGGVSVTGFDYVNSLDSVHPILSQCIAASNDAANLDEERDVELCCVQTKAVQLLSLSGEMVPPPKSMEVPNSVTLVEEEENGAEEFEEDYDMEDDPGTEFSTEHDTDNEASKNESDAANPFSNWLGALATGNAAAPPPMPPATTTAPPPPPGLDFMFPPPPPPGMAPAEAHPVKEEMAFLSPMTLLGKNNEPTPELALSTDVVNAKKSAGRKKKDGKKSPPTTILQRQEKETRSASHPSGSNVDIRSMESAIERIMATQMKSLESKVLDAVKKTVSSEVEKAMGSNKAKSTMEKAAKESANVAAREAVAAMQTPMVTTLHQVSLQISLYCLIGKQVTFTVILSQTMKEIMIPAYETATTQMFHQISKSLDEGLAQMANNQAQASQPSMEAMSMQMIKMAEAIKTLSSEIAQLKAGGAATNNTAQSTTKPQPKQADVRQEILALCQSRRYEEAFTKAVSAANGDVVVFTCKHADITAAFNGEVTLSQTILICLMQQLGAVLVSATDSADFKIIVTWLQEIAVTIDPTNENIQRREFSVRCFLSS